jgi:subtilisin family serine protease
MRNRVRRRALVGVWCLALGAAVWLTAVPAATQSGRATEFDRVNGYDAVAGEVIVKLRGSPSDEALDNLGLRIAAERREPVGSLGARLFRSRSFDADALVRFLSVQPDVEYAEPNYILYVNDTVPNDPMFPQLWGLANPTLPGADVRATKAWDVSTGTTSVAVAVVDTGIDYNHPDLAANVWSAPSSFTVTISGANIICAAGTHGFNAITSTCDPLDDNDHGTHVAGTIGALGNNSRGVVGVNWVTQIVGAKFLGANGSGSTVNAIRAIEFVIQMKQRFGASANVRVLSNSWGGGGFSQSLLDEINKAGANDMLFVAAAGNSGSNNDSSPHYPSSYGAPNVLAVAATNQTDGLASFSNYGATSVDLGAPGVSITSTTRNNTYKSFSGTSMATPHVSGGAALVLSRCALATSALKATLMGHVTPLGSLAGISVTGGRLDVNASIRSCASTSPGPPASPTGLTATAGNAQIALSWTASAGASSYAVKRGLASGGPYSTVVAANLTTPGFIDGSVVNGTAYYYVVTASNSAGESLPSGEASATPVAPPAPSLPAAPTNLTASPTGNKKITLSWMAASGASSYNVKRSTTSGGPYSTIATGVTSATYTNAGLKAGTTYYYVVSGVNGAGQGPDSGQASTTATGPR